MSVFNIILAKPVYQSIYFPDSFSFLQCLIYTSSKIFISILSLALIAHQNNYVRPILTEDTFLDIKNGRYLFPLSKGFLESR